MAGTAWKTLKPSGRTRDLSNISELKTLFFSEKLDFGELVSLKGRLSQYCPIYFPIAYNCLLTGPRPIVLDTGSRKVEGFSMDPTYNPAVTRMYTKAVSGDTIAFLFDTNVSHTPRLVSFYHPDRSTEIPFHSTEPGIPVLIDTTSEPHLERIVELTARVVRLDETISAVIDESKEEVVRGYYHAFYKYDFYPNKGFILDAREDSGGNTKPTLEVSPFSTSVGLELSYTGELGEEQLDGIAGHVLGAKTTQPVGRYQPAYYTPKGYKIIQHASGNEAVHLAPELGAISITTKIQSTGPYSEHVTQAFLPFAADLISVIRKEDSSARFKVLFESDPTFSGRVLGV